MARPTGSRDQRPEVPTWLSPHGRVRTLYTNPHNGGRIVVHSISEKEPGQRLRVRVELICDVLYWAFDVLRVLRKKTTIEEVALKLPVGVTKPNNVHDRRVFDVLQGLPVTTDPGWAGR